MSVSLKSQVKEHSATPDSNPRPILIAGITPRSGTNFLYRLLSLHPDCVSPPYEPVQEDYLLHHADALDEYVDRLSWQWGHWGDAGPACGQLLAQLGRGLTRFLAPESNTSVVVTKTPSVRNVHRFFDLFPHGRLLVLVRDGRSVVSSAMEGFGWDFESTARQWTRAARTVLDLQKTHGLVSDQHRVVYYENLSSDPVSSLTRIFRVLPLDAEDYDFDEALNLPIYGSSFVGDEDDDVTWQPQDKPETFNTKKRWAPWSEERHARFNWIGSEELTRLGYHPKDTPSGPTNHLRQYAADLQHNASQLPRRLRRSAREGIYSFMEAFREEL